MEKNENVSAKKQLSTILFDIKSSVNTFEKVWIMSLDGRVVSATNSEEIGLDYSKRDFFVKGRKGNSGDIFFLDKNKKLKGYLSGPLILDGKLLGVIAVEYVPADLIGAVTDYHEMGNTGESYLVKKDKDNKPIALTPLRFAKDMKTISRSMYLAAEGKALTLAEASDYRGEKVISVIRYIKGPDFGLIVEMDINEVYEQPIELRNFLMLTVIIMAAVIFVFSLYFSKKITKPIQKLNETAREITDGNFSERAEILSSDEIGSLALSFNQMTQRLVDVNNDLERRVKERTAELSETNKELSSVTYILSHDLKEPLRGISQLADLLITDYEGILDETGKKYLSMLIKRVRRMYALMDGVLKYTAPENLQFEKKNIDVGELLKEVINSLKVPGNFEIIIENAMPTIMSREILIEQIFYHLIHNSIKFMDKPHGVIKIGCVREGDFWKFHVEDNGPGIDKKYHQKLYDLFYLLKPRDELESVGIGLPVVKKFLDILGGQIWVESIPGKWCTFFFTIPVN